MTITNPTFNYLIIKHEGLVNKKEKNGGANLGFEEKLWKSADSLRKNMDAGEYKHIVLGLIFLKYVTDAFEERHNQLLNEKSEGADPEDRDEYLGHNVFWIPKKSRWSEIQAQAKKPTIGQIIDNAMISIEKENSSIKGTLPKDYSRPALDKTNLGKLIDLIGTIGLGEKENRSKDILGRVYEYFLGKFASAEGKGAGQFYTPPSIVKLLIEIIKPYKGRVFDPCCGSGGMFVQSEKFIEKHGGKKEDISIFGQESNETTWRLARMNLALRGIDADIKWNNEGSFLKDEHIGLNADFVLANPPFNDSEWSGEKLRDDVRWDFGAPPVGNANFAWVQHFIHHLSPKGIAGFVLANGSLSSETSNEGDIRKEIIDADLIDCIVSLPSQLFYSTPIAACLWFVTRNKKNSKLRDRTKETLFIDARHMGNLVDRKHRELTDDEINKISETYHSWRGEKSPKPYQNIPGYCKSCKLEEIQSHNVLLPGRYVGTTKNLKTNEDNLDKNISSLFEKLNEQFIESNKLEKEIKQKFGSV